jgi:hypothetical protein
VCCLGMVKVMVPSRHVTSSVRRLGSSVPVIKNKDLLDDAVET